MDRPDATRHAPRVGDRVGMWPETMNAVVVTGDRHALRDPWERVVESVLTAYLPPSRPLLVVHGSAPGIDAITHRIAEAFPSFWPVAMPADWKGLGNRAGPIRNLAMLSLLHLLRSHGYSTAIFAFHNDLPASKGTRHLVNEAVKMTFPVILTTSAGISTAITDIVTPTPIPEAPAE